MSEFESPFKLDKSLRDGQTPFQHTTFQAKENGEPVFRTAPTLNFRCRPERIMLELLWHPDQVDPEFKPVAKALREKAESDYPNELRMSGHDREVFLALRNGELDDTRVMKIVSAFHRLSETEAGQLVLHSAATRATQVESEWNRNCEHSTALMERITGLNFQDFSFQVDILPEFVRAGSYAGEGKINWGGRDLFSPNYSTVYLWHEVLHHEDLLGAAEPVSHAVIELATDYELTKALAPGVNPIGHEVLELVKADMLPAWEQFLENRGEKTLLTFRDERVAHYGREDPPAYVPRNWRDYPADRASFDWANDS